MTKKKGLSIMDVIMIFLILGKLTGVLAISWWIVFAPIIAAWVLFFFFILMNKAGVWRYGRKSNTMVN